MKKEVLQFFQELFMEKESTGNYSSLPMFFPKLTESEVSSLCASVNELEVKQSVFSIGGPNGFPAIFFQKFWSICKNDLITLVSECFGGDWVPSDVNSTLISLIQKVPSPNNLTQFRPISLCNTSYKIINKILVQRLRGFLPDLISPNQVAFVSGRQIQDNIVMAQEVLHKFKTMRGKRGYIAWKIDLAKAYDKLQWGFMKRVLEEVGIVVELNNLFMSCISNVNYKVIVSGDMTRDF
ncbi:hypothetical protein Ddye_024037 [Dipteronia dyeriana]|uniref:Reverse transcriptase domain-containing protein n=1 Tax=Dipteronia dyeriana TaxID=168575 RepID=A0AAD9TV15_9ROSI|nr:hypothetical protein Ddye_024037 [Dipteronia dyeriana]